MSKAILLFSGGLDSILAAAILQKQKVKTTLLCFESCFFDCQAARKAAKKLSLKLRTVDFSKEHLKIVKKPKYGRGRGMNSCLDCHLLMVKTAKKIMEKSGFDFMATGEVLGQRPFSQKKRALLEIEKAVGLKNQILRPLSAKLLPETEAEKRGAVNRKLLFAFRGKSRKPQLALAKSLKVSYFPGPAGGCILTDSEYSKKLKELFKKAPSVNGSDCRILRKGRVFWQGKFLIIIGRNKKDNADLEKEKTKKDLILRPGNFSGPTVLLRGFGQRIKKETVEKAAELLLRYSRVLAIFAFWAIFLKI